MKILFVFHFISFFIAALLACRYVRTYSIINIHQMTVICAVTHTERVYISFFNIFSYVCCLFLLGSQQLQFPSLKLDLALCTHVAKVTARKHAQKLRWKEKKTDEEKRLKIKFKSATMTAATAGAVLGFCL